MTLLVDTHAHLDDEAFAGELPDLLARARAAGVAGVVTVGVDLASSRRAVEIAREQELVFAAVGIHPHEAEGATSEELGAIERLAAEGPEVVAVGEIGLDHYRDHAPREAQAAAFRAQLALAERIGKPVILHERGAAGPFLEALRAEAGRRGAPLGGVAHCFSADAARAEEYVGLGLFVSFAGNATYPKSGALREALAAVPDRRLLFETDCPYLAPQRVRGKR